jgi:hypothetical protein
MDKVINIYNLKINNKAQAVNKYFSEIPDQGMVFIVKQLCDNLLKK